MQSMTSTAPAETEKGRAQRREEQRLAAQKDMLDAQHRRRVRMQVPIMERVQTAAKRLAGTNVGTAIGIIEAVGPREQEAFILAEIYEGKNRKQVLSQFIVPRKETTEEYLRAVAERSGNPDEEG